MVATQGFVFSVVSMGALTPVGRSRPCTPISTVSTRIESGIIRQCGCTVVLQSHAEVTERCTETADAEPSPDINTESEMQGMARYCYASMHVYIYIYIYIYIYYGKHQCFLYTIIIISIAHFSAFFRWFS